MSEHTYLTPEALSIIRNLHRVPEVMWNDVIEAISETVFLGLNPQPAQQGDEVKK